MSALASSSAEASEATTTPCGSGTELILAGLGTTDCSAAGLA